MSWKHWLMAFAGIAVLVFGWVGLRYLNMNHRLRPAEERRWANGIISEPFASKKFKEIAAMLHPDTDGSKPTVAVYSTPSSRHAASPFRLTDLSEQGQAHAIDFLAKEPATAEATWLQLARTLTGPGGDAGHKDPYRADRVLIATVTKGMDALPGDRLLWTRVYVEPINFEFAGYTVAATETKEFKVASIESTKSNKVELSAGIAATPPGVPNPEAHETLEQTNKATADVSQQYESLGIDIRPDYLRIIRESAAGGDVAGNAALELSVVTDPTMIRRLDAKGLIPTTTNEQLVLVVQYARLTDGTKDLDAAHAKITVLPQSVLPHCSLRANVRMLYEMRTIRTWREYYLEGLQEVELLRDGFEVKGVEIVRADDIAPAVWSIRMLPNDKADTTKAQDGKHLMAKTGSGTERELVFTDFVTASELTHWLKAHPNEKKLQELEFTDRGDMKLVPFKDTVDACWPKS